jgi:hypothetical protein
VIDRPTARKPSDDDDIVVLDIIHINFLDRVLVPPDDYGRFVDVKKQNLFLRATLLIRYSSMARFIRGSLLGSFSTNSIITPETV